jgi:methyl-accepting chemotaxis protein
MGPETNPLNAAVVVLFGYPMAGIWISAGILLSCAFVIYHNGRKHHFPKSKALVARIRALQVVLAAPSADEAQTAFASHFFEIDEAMRDGAGEMDELRQAWTQFRETILDESEVPMRATSRAEGYFLHLCDDTRVLAWWANLFVAFGLTFTFLGIVAALTSTSATLSAGSGSSNMTPALINLLTITSVKFWTSIAGVGASIVLRWFDRRWHSLTLRKLEKITEALDYGTLFSPPQRIAAEQLRETKEQTAALKTFSHELAVAIGENLDRQMQPMISVLSGIQTSIDDFKSGSFNQIGKELGEALSRQAGTEMAQLGAALGEMTTQLSSIHENLEGSGRAANEQIAAAARDFASSSETMNSMFSTLNDRVAETGTRLNEAAESSINSAMERFAGATSGIQSAFDQMRGEIVDYGERLTRGANEAADRNAEVLAKAAAALEGATAHASEGMGQAIDAAVARASEESAKAISAAFASFGERFEQASSGLVETLRSTAGRMESLVASIERSTSASEDHAANLTRAGAEAQGMAVALGRAANDIQGAAAPIRSATEAIGSGVANLQESIRRQADAAIANHEAIGMITERLGETSSAAARAWSDYRDRFEGVDKALAESLAQLKDVSGEHAVHLNEQVGRIDNSLAGAVEKLAAALDPLTELAEQIEDLLGKMKTAA